ncbi:hypothetical protein J2W32_004458 [Variovorax boronicumulans]|uniref:Uncharacterized protein n=1 Tax=Variovorax boronicumulans TaxID=436515 RepID=A0AAW8CYD5_9BURK|nr:hypothetical protein [Variovorax boronicumulans]MDP9895360.1 hypothetical protein [Variovorax boronicumulans]MDQ0055400.1 hypothetical protein [Variovorax boronicumulans]
MQQDVPKPEANTGPFALTPEEYRLMEHGVFVTKSKPGDIVQSNYHKWHVIWEQDRRFTLAGGPPDDIYRAVSLSLPLAIAYKALPPSIPYDGYVLGMPLKTGVTTAFASGTVLWVEA